MSLEALWSVQFHANGGIAGSGIVVFENGRLYGGDSMMIYTGTYKVSNGQIEGDLEVEKYANAPGMVSVVGLNKFKLKVSGPLTDGTLTLSAYVVEDPSRKMTIKAVRRKLLP
jgi:hypothetical protein